jgi:hypothetical protein
MDNFALTNYGHLFYHIPPMLAIAGYLKYPQNVRLQPTILHFFSVAHNTGLIIFSGWTFLSLCKILYNNGIVFQPNYYFSIPEFEKIIFYFYLSKYYEFFDTFLIYLKGKKPVFLQTFHHIGAVISWHLAYVYQIEGVWIPSLVNSFVHTVMYSYYLGYLLRIKQVQFIKKYITSLQLFQLVVPNIFGLYYYRYTEVPFKYNIVLMLEIYIIGLVLLFGSFYYKNYITLPEKKGV